MEKDTQTEKKKYTYIRKTEWFNGKKYEGKGKTEQEAYRKLADKIAEARRGEETIGGNMAVSAWYKQWKSTYKDHKGLTPKSLAMYDEKFNIYIKPAVGSMKIKDVRDIHLQRVLNKEAGKSSSHLKKIRMVMQEMFRRARQSKIIQYDPAELLDLPSATNNRRRSITEEERDAILKVAETHRSGLWILTLLYTGMRPGETAALTWSDIDFEKDEIRIHAAKESGSSTIKGPKTKAGSRVLPHIPSALLPRLLLEERKPMSPVFQTGNGNFQNENSMRRLWTGFRRELDIYMGAKLKRNKIVESSLAPDLTPYCLRHTFATDCARAGVPLETVRWLMGHEDISTTANIYQHPDNTALRNGLYLLDGGKRGGKPLFDSSKSTAMQ